MSPDIGLEGPEELEELAFRKINEGKVKDGLKLVLRAARGYEREGKIRDAARLYKYLGYLLLEKTNDVDKARPPLLKAAYLYIDLIEEHVSRPEVDIDVLDEYCSNVLEVFVTLNDKGNLMKYTKEFAGIYEDLGDSYRENEDIPMAIRAYESAYRYYRAINDIESYRRLAETLISLYGRVAETKLENNDLLGAAEAFYRLASFIHTIFGYDVHFIEMMDTAAKNFEKASKIFYSQGDLDGTTSALVKAQYAYLLSKNFGRAKLIGLNTTRMLYQVVSSYRARGDDEKTAEKLMELAEALIGIGKLEDAMKAYKSVLDIKSGLRFRVRVRGAVLKYYAATKESEKVLEDVEAIEYYLSRKAYPRGLELAENTMLRAGLEEALEKIHEAEGIYQP
nr:hypothetical protein [Thermococcus celer]